MTSAYSSSLANVTCSCTLSARQAVMLCGKTLICVGAFRTETAHSASTPLYATARMTASPRLTPLTSPRWSTRTTSSSLEVNETFAAASPSSNCGTSRSRSPTAMVISFSLNHIRVGSASTVTSTCAVSASFVTAVAVTVAVPSPTA